jgi:lysophospholipase L1-like esterase
MPEKQGRGLKDKKPRRSMRVRVLFPLISLLMVGILGAVVLEVGFRLREKHRTDVGGTYPGLSYRHVQLGHSLIPNAHYFDRVTINSLGFRGPDIDVAKPAGTIRILCMGGSTTFDTYVTSNDRTWPQQLERYLGELHPGVDFEVINAGISGYKVLDSLINFHMRLKSLQPDIMIVYHAHNDISANRNYYLPTPENPRPGEVLTESRLMGFVRERSLAYRKIRMFLRHLARKKRSQRSARFDEPSQVGIENFQDGLSLIGLLSVRHGIPLVMPRVVVSFRPEMPRDQQTEQARHYLVYCKHLTLEGVLEAYERYNATIRDVAAEFDALYVDETGSIPGGDEYFADGVHFTDEGARLFAQIVGERIVAAGLVERVAASRDGDSLVR